MHYKIEQAQGYVRAELSDRRTPEENLDFIRAICAHCAQTGCVRILVSVRKSRPIYKINTYGITEYFRQLASNPGSRVALVSDSDDMRSSQQYIEMLGREQGAQVKAFRDEPAAIEWLRGASPS